MDARPNETSLGELTSEVGGMMTGLGVLSVMAVPFAVPLVALTALLALPLVVLALPVLAGWLLVEAVRRPRRALLRARGR